MVGFNVTLSWGRIEWLPKLSILFAYPLRAPHTYAYSSLRTTALEDTLGNALSMTSVWSAYENMTMNLTLAYDVLLVWPWV